MLYGQLDEKNENLKFMGKEIDLLINYPKPKRNLDKRSSEKSKDDVSIARNFGKEFFDGDRKHGYGGFKYDPKFWQPVIPTFKKYWNLTSENSILDVGCAKGFMLFDLYKMIPGINLAGVDISEYAINNSPEEIKKNLTIANVKKLPFPPKSFDVVISINTIHNLEKDECALALQEISRVSKKHSFVTVDAYRNDEEKKRMMEWNLTAKTIMSVNDWISFFKKVNYKGDYYWFIP
jgi:SAM-dependent methyltransferase